jgi:hypothetical protein
VPLSCEQTAREHSNEFSNLALYATLVSLPGIGIAYLTWKLSRHMRLILAQAIFRAGFEHGPGACPCKCAYHENRRGWLWKE